MVDIDMLASAPGLFHFKMWVERTCRLTIRARILDSTRSAKTIQQSIGPNMIARHAANTFLLTDIVMLANCLLADCVAD